MLVQEELKSTKDLKSSKQLPPQIQEKPDIPECELLMINNIKVDLLVLKLIKYCWGMSKLTSLKFCRNKLEDKVEEALIDMVSDPNFKLNKLFLEWNPLINPDRYSKMYSLNKIMK